MKKKNPKEFAIDLRNGGYSYSEIQKFCPVPKSTLSYWFRNIKLSEPQQERLKKKRIESAKRGSKAKSLKVFKTIEEIQKTALKDIGKISKRELWLMGIILYWRERLLNKNESDLKRGVRFTSSDPEIINLFIKWLLIAGGIERNEICFDLYIAKDNQDLLSQTVEYWSKETGFSKDNFFRYYVLKKSKKSLLKIRVKSSSMLARQISGWARGVSRIVKDL